MSTLFLHIGMPKTGTSYIQSFLHNNNEILKSKGVTFPAFDITFDGVEEYRNGNFLVCQMKDENGKRDNILEKEVFDKCFKTVHKLSKKYQNIILSDESIWNSSKLNYSGDLWPELLGKVKQYNLDLKVIVYLRRQDLFIHSFWAQQVKGTCDLPFNEYLESKGFKSVRLDYFTRLNEIAEYVGKDNIIVRAYEDKQFVGGSLVADFLDIFGIELTDEFDVNQKHINLTLEGIFLHTKLIMNKFDEFKVRRGYFIADLKKVMHQNKDSRLAQRVNYFTYEDQVNFIEKYKEQNALVAKEYLNKPDSELFDYYVPEEDNRNVIFEDKEVLPVLAQVLINKSKEAESIREDNRVKQEVLDRLKDNFIERFRTSYREKKKAKLEAQMAAEEAGE